MEPPRNTHLGQHFLREPRIARRIMEAAEVGPGMRVLEIGPGGGVLTEPLCDAVGEDGHVVAIEADPRFAERLDAPNLRVVQGDAVQVDLATFGPFDRIVANLPYQISGPITARLLDLHREQGWGLAVLMFQKEFADRLLAGPGSKQYGRLSVHTARVGTVRKVRDVPPGCFEPPPKVHSTVVRIDPHVHAPFTVADDGLWAAVVDGTFQQRRKQLKNTLPAAVQAAGGDGDAAATALQDLGVATERPEQVAPDMFAVIVQRIVDAGDA